MKKLYLSEKNRKIGGICGGLGEYFSTDATLFRILFVIVTLLTGGLGVIAYLLMWVIIPRRPKKPTQ